ncbi:MAG: ABC transporter permease [Xanthobacteraceae bacterium]|nr:MAG: ABC transporter permease [Xanthobacteraceae bacterium]
MSPQFHLVTSLTRREIVGRYRSSALGLLWSLLTPLLMLSIYTFVFGSVFNARWTAGDGHSTSEFAVILFAGLIVFQIFSEVINRAPTLVLSNVNYVKKVVFPLQILPLVAMGSALFHAVVSLLVLVPFILITRGAIAPTALLLPLVLAPFVVLTLGLSWFLASLGVYVRDIGQILGSVITALMFLSPIFYPSSALPANLHRWLALNPVALPVEQTRDVLIFGHLPDFIALGIYAAVAGVVCVAGYAWFQKTRKGFADVI